MPTRARGRHDAVGELAHVADSRSWRSAERCHRHAARLGLAARAVRGRLPELQRSGRVEQAQREDFAAPFAAPDGERDAVAFVGAHGLDDHAEPDCEAEWRRSARPPGPPSHRDARALRASGEAALPSVGALARCAMGLRAESSAPSSPGKALFLATRGKPEPHRRGRGAAGRGGKCVVYSRLAVTSTRKRLQRR